MKKYRKRKRLLVTPRFKQAWATTYEGKTYSSEEVKAAERELSAKGAYGLSMQPINSPMERNPTSNIATRSPSPRRKSKSNRRSKARSRSIKHRRLYTRPVRGFKRWGKD